MKKYLLIFSFIFLCSSLVSSFSVLFTKDEPIIEQTNLSSQTPSVTEKVEPVKDFTQIDLQTVEKEIIENPLSFDMPVKSNEIGMKFSNGQLVYSKTLQEWITHNGIDIVASLGTPVFASESGKIIEISNNATDGIKIVIEHKDGYKTVYSNLSSDKMVKKNQEIKKGDVISGIGKTSTFEYNEKDHLHFEIYKDDKAINPLGLLESTE